MNVKTKVPIKNALVVQLTRWIGIWKTMLPVICNRSLISGSLTSGSGQSSRSLSAGADRLRDRSSQDHVRFGPAMDRATVCAGKFLAHHLCGWPAFLFDRPTRISEFRSGRTTHEQAFQICAGLRFGAPRRIKIKSSCHIRGGKQSVLWRCRKATSASLPDRLPSAG